MPQIPATPEGAEIQDAIDALRDALLSLVAEAESGL